MQARARYFGGILTLVLATTAGVSSSAIAKQPDVVPLRYPNQATGTGHSLTPGNTCFRQAGTDSVQVTSQHFEKALEDVSARGADDFQLSKACSITEVDVTGSYTDTKPARSFEVTFYEDDQGTPGNIVQSLPRLAVTDDGQGNFVISLGAPLQLGKGTYWISVQANMSLTKAGQWLWSTTTGGTGTDNQWKNPRDGFGTGCTTYGDLRDCLGAGDTGFHFVLVK